MELGLARFFRTAEGILIKNRARAHFFSSLPAPYSSRLENLFRSNEFLCYAKIVFPRPRASEISNMENRNVPGSGHCVFSLSILFFILFFFFLVVATPAMYRCFLFAIKLPKLLTRIVDALGVRTLCLLMKFAPKTDSVDSICCVTVWGRWSNFELLDFFQWLDISKDRKRSRLYNK